MASEPISILLVDDEADFVEMLALILKDHGDRVHTAVSGQECLERLCGQAIDVVLLDVRMPGLDGIETLRRIKRRHPLVEVIMLTGHGTADRAIAAMELGAFDFLHKPTDYDELLAAVTAAAARKTDQERRIRLARARAVPTVRDVLATSIPVGSNLNEKRRKSHD